MDWADVRALNHCNLENVLCEISLSIVARHTQCIHSPTNTQNTQHRLVATVVKHILSKQIKDASAFYFVCFLLRVVFGYRQLRYRSMSIKKFHECFCQASSAMTILDYVSGICNDALDFAKNGMNCIQYLTEYRRTYQKGFSKAIAYARRDFLPFWRRVDTRLTGWKSSFVFLFYCIFSRLPKVLDIDIIKQKHMRQRFKVVTEWLASFGIWELPNLN